VESPAKLDILLVVAPPTNGDLEAFLNRLHVVYQLFIAGQAAFYISGLSNGEHIFSSSTYSCVPVSIDMGF
jgi:hypothetical protein